MNRHEYLANKFKKDFIQYSLLQKDSLPAKAIANRLYHTIDLHGIISNAKQETDILCNRYLSFDKVKSGNKLSNELSQELAYDLKDRIIAEFQSYLDSYSNQEITKSVLTKVVKEVELQAWHNGIANMREAIALFAEKLDNLAKSYDDTHIEILSETELKSKFYCAKENTWLERIQGNNIDDIIEYRNALMEYVKGYCENLLYTKLKTICNTIACDRALDELQDNFSALLKYALELKTSLPQLPVDENWDKEYNLIVPTDFYRRNVESITPKQAFYTVLLQFFAKNEEWLVENGMLVEGELKIYVNKHSYLPILVETMCEKLIHMP